MATKKRRALRELENRILRLIEKRSLTVGSIGYHLGATRSQTERALAFLVECGLADCDRGYYFKRFAA